MKTKTPETSAQEETKAAPELPIINVVIGEQYTYFDSAMANPVTVCDIYYDLKSGSLKVHFIDADGGRWATDCSAFLLGQWMGGGELI